MEQLQADVAARVGRDRIEAAHAAGVYGDMSTETLTRNVRAFTAENEESAL